MTRRETMIQKLGSEEAYKAYMRNLGAKGGGAPHSVPRTFAKDHSLAKRAGKLGRKRRYGR